MAERTVAQALSGAEIKTALVDKFSEALERDCFFHRDAQYDSFSGSIKFEINLHAIDTLTATGEAKAASGELPDFDHGTKTQEGVIEVNPEPPNAVRVKTGQPVPTDSGKKIKYSREVAGKKSA